MLVAVRKANIRAAVWATAISGTGLAAMLLARHLFLRGGMIDPEAMIFQRVGMLMLLPGIVIFVVVTLIAQLVMHSALVYYYLRAGHGEDSYVIAFDSGFGGFIPPLITWAVYFLIARMYYRRKMRRAVRSEL
jgi:hypothetical protein